MSNANLRVSVDVGYGYIKAFSENGGKVNFPSLIARRRGAGSLSEEVSSANEDYAVTYWETGRETSSAERRAYVGNAALVNGAVRRWEDKDVIHEDDIKLYVATAIGVLNRMNQPVDLCLGLPMTEYYQNKDKLRGILEGLTAKIAYEKGSIQDVVINTVFIFPQGAGAYYGAILKPDGSIRDYNLADSSVGVIDIGFRTVDYLVMAKGPNGISLNDSLSGSLEDDGMNVAFQDIEKTLSQKLDREVGLPEVEKAILWFGSQLTHRREKIDLKPYEKQSYMDLADRISSQIKLKWGKESDALGTILITGGGGAVLYPFLKEKFDQAELQKESQYGNSEGYLGAHARKTNSLQVKEGIEDVAV